MLTSKSEGMFSYEYANRKQQGTAHKYSDSEEKLWNSGSGRVTDKQCDINLRCKKVEKNGILMNYTFTIHLHVHIVWYCPIICMEYFLPCWLSRWLQICFSSWNLPLAHVILLCYWNHFLWDFRQFAHMCGCICDI